jgi:hypothetical protein
VNQKPKLSENPVAGYLTGAVIMSGSALVASLLPITYIMVILLLSVPSLFTGYFFAPVFTKYSLGLLTGLCVYMSVEYLIYGPIYKVTGPVYAASYIFAVASVLLARLVYIRRHLIKNK